MKFKSLSFVSFIIAMCISLSSIAATDPKVWSVDDLTELRQIKPGNNRNLNRFDGDLAAVYDIDGDGTLGLYRFTARITTTESAPTVIAPNVGLGRWLLVSASNGEIERDTTTGSRLLVARSEYSFATDGGAVGNITLRGDTLPLNAVPTVCYYFVDQAFTSGTSAAEIALSYKYDGSTYNIFKAAAVISSIGTAGMKATLFTGPADGATRNKVASGSGSGSFRLAVSVEAVTAGKLTLICEYLVGQ